MNKHALSRIGPTSLFALAYLGAFFVSKWAALSLGYALDDYVVALQGHVTDLSTQFIGQGRFSFALVQYLLVSANLSMADFSTIGFLAMGIFSCLFFSRSLKVSESDNQFLTVSSAAILGAYPYMAEYASFRQAALPMSLMFLLMWVAFRYYAKWATQSHRAANLGIALVFSVLAAGLNQLAISFLCIGVLFFHSRSMIINGEKGWLKQWIVPITSSAVSGLVISALYLLSAYFVRVALNIPANDRMGLVGLSLMLDRVGQVVDLTERLSVGSEVILSSTSKIIAWIGYVGLMFLFSKRHLYNVIYSVAALIVGYGFAIAPIAISSTWWPVPRTLIAVPFAFVGAVLLLANVTTSIRTGISASLMFLAAVMFAAHSNAVLTNQLRLNRWDMTQAANIATAAERDFPNASGHVALNGAKWAYPVAPSIAYGDLNVSALNVGWAVDALFEEATGRTLTVRTTNEYSKDCAARVPFPGRDSMFRVGAEVVVCM